MTMLDALPTALLRVRACLLAQLGNNVEGRVYTPHAPIGVRLPCHVWQSQDGGGTGVAYLGQMQWSGLVTIRSFANSQDTADALALATAQTLPGSYMQDGTGVTIHLKKPLPPGPTTETDTIFMTAYLYDMTVTGG